MEKLDLSALDTKKGAEAGFEVQLSHPQTGALLPIWITVLGADSDTYQATAKAQQRKRADKLMRGRRFQFATPDEQEEDDLDLLSTVTTGWRAEADLDGKPWPAFSAAVARALYKRFPWIKEQLFTATADRANFLPRSASG